jgi:hypothetical protein
MLILMMGKVMLALACLSMTGCNIYHENGYGRVVSSRLDESSVTAVELPPNASFISQRYLPQDAPSKSEHEGIDILVPSRTPVLAAEALSLSYPVPCLDVDWQ